MASCLMQISFLKNIFYGEHSFESLCGRFRTILPKNIEKNCSCGTLKTLTSRSIELRTDSIFTFRFCSNRF